MAILLLIFTFHTLKLRIFSVTPGLMLTKCLDSSRQFLPGLLDPRLLLEDFLIRDADLAHQRLARIDEGRWVLLDVGSGRGLAAGRVLGDVEMGGDARQQLVVSNPGTCGPGNIKMLDSRVG